MVGTQVLICERDGLVLHRNTDLNNPPTRVQTGIFSVVNVS